jgi:hypothetical protein
MCLMCNGRVQWAEGQAMTLEQAIAFALDQSKPENAAQ